MCLNFETEVRMTTYTGSREPAGDIDISAVRFPLSRSGDASDGLATAGSHEPALRSSVSHGVQTVSCNFEHRRPQCWP